MNISLTRALAALLLLLPAACSLPVQQPAEGLMDWAQRQSYLSQIDTWRVDGRIAMQSQDDAWSASLKWQQRNTDYDLKLFGPLGRKALSVIGGADYVILTTDEGETFSESSATSLIYRQTGWQVPVENLRYWARAMAVPGQAEISQHDEQGRLQELSQSGWVIHYESYQQAGQLQMPRKMRLEHEHFTVKLILRDWQLGPGNQGNS
ncbi:MAG TPA: lipoprotein insertase outer membrane protein LolB [Gammaproteobacteria bacterium]|jgi:outer membrane lipoprotein LolB